MNWVPLLILLIIPLITVQAGVNDRQDKTTESLRAVLEQYISPNSNKHIRIEASLVKEYLIFFDTPELALLKKNANLVYHASADLTVKKTKRNKIKKVLTYQYQQTYDIPTKQYDKVKNIMDKHPLFFLVKRRARRDLEQQLKTDGIAQPLRIKTVFSSAKNTQKVQLYDTNKKTLTLSLASYAIEVFNFNLHFSMLTVVPALNKQDNKQFRKLTTQLQQHYKNTRKVTGEESEYQIIYAYLQSKIGYIDYLIKYPEYVKLIMALLMAGIGLIIIKLLFWRRFLLYNKE